MKTTFKWTDFLIITLITSIWVNASEVFRYFIIVRPEMQVYLAALNNAVDMNLNIFLIWGLWDTLLSGLLVLIFWLYTQVFGNNIKSITLSAITSWCLFFVLFWIGMANMGLSRWAFLPLVLPLALFETLLASTIAARLYARKSPT